MKSQLKVGTMILSIILASDKTHLTNFSGDKSMHAVYMSLGNIHKDIQRKLSAQTWLLVAKIPVSKFPHTKFQCSKTEQKAMRRILCQCLVHMCMRIILSLTCLDTHKYHVVPGPDGFLWLMMAIMMAWVADLEEQLMIAGIWSYSCPVCMASHHDLDCWQDAVSHAPHSAEAMLAEIQDSCRLFPKASTYEFKKEVKKCESGLSGAVEEFCWGGLPVGPNVFITQDLLHSCYKFIWDHVAEWLTHIVGEDELDLHFKAQPNLGFHNFSNAISKISQPTVHHHKPSLYF